MALTPLAQAVVTDPGGGSHGYTLIASSPTLALEDAEFLERSPGISDFLHTEAKPRPCFSFFQLPSGAWALSRRFTSGKRRGDFNRIVVHTLVMQKDVLEILGWEPSLLTSHCIYSGDPSGRELEAHELSKIAADQGLKSLPDLDCLPPADVPQALISLATQRRTFMLRTFGESELETHLRALFGALEAGMGALLPQELAHEELLRFTWSSLPAADRQRIAWTTHMAPGVRTEFRLQNAPDPAHARNRLGNVNDGWVFGQESPAASESASALARAVATDQPPVAQRLADLARWSERLTLFDGQGAVGGWLNYLNRWSRQIGQGCRSLKELKAFYADVTQASEVAPWVESSSILLCTRNSLQSLSRNRKGYRETIDVVDQALADYGLKTILRPELLETLPRETFGDLDALMLALTLKSLVGQPHASTKRDKLYDLLVAGRKIQLSPITGDVLLDLAISFVAESKKNQDLGYQILAYLAQKDPQALASVPSRLANLQDPLPLAAFLIDQGEKATEATEVWSALRDTLTESILLPGFRDQDTVDQRFGAERLRSTLKNSTAQNLAAALAAWRGEPLRQAIAVLRRDIRDASGRARATLAEIDTETEIEPEQNLPGTSQELHTLGVPFHQWLPFAIAEAVWFDHGNGANQLAEKVFGPLADVRPNDAEASLGLSRVLQTLAENAAFAGRCHRILFGWVQKASADQADELVRTFSHFFAELTRRPQAQHELFTWGPLTTTTAEQLAEARFAPYASRLLADYWIALADLKALPPEALISSLDRIQQDERLTVFQAWRHRIAELSKKQNGKPLAKKLASFEGKHGSAARTIRTAEIEQKIDAPGPKSVANINQYVETVGGKPEALRDMLKLKVFTAPEPDRSLEVLNLLTSSEAFWPEIYEVLEKYFLGKAIDEVLDSQPKWLQNTERLTRREQILIRVAKKLALLSRSPQRAHTATDFLAWALDAKWQKESIETRSGITPKRSLFLGILIQESEVAREQDSRDLIDHLIEQQRTELLGKLLVEAEGSARPYLARFLPKLRVAVASKAS